MTKPDIDGAEISPSEQQPNTPTQATKDRETPSPPKEKDEPSAKAVQETPAEAASQPAREDSPVKPDEDQAQSSEHSDKDQGKKGREADEIAELTSPQSLRQTTSEAWDFLSVLRQFVTGSQRGMLVERDVHVGGDFVFQVGREAAGRVADTPAHSNKAYPLSAEDKRRIEYVYQQPLAYSTQCYPKLLNRHVVFLLGQAHVGKRATAIRLALDALRSAENVPLEYGGDIDLPSITWQPNTAYIVNDFSYLLNNPG
jgi:hypothetical protein